MHDFDFYPRSPCGERRASGRPILAAMRLFLSTLSLRRATDSVVGKMVGKTISIHALLAESDETHFSIFTPNCYFYPRSPCGERHTWARGSRVTYVISIHALLAESDRIHHQFPCQNRDFYPRSPCGERPVCSSLFGTSSTISIHALLAESDTGIRIASNL